MDFKYLVPLGAFIVGICAIYKDWIKTKLGKRNEYVLLLFLLISFIWSCINVYDSEKKLANEVKKKYTDSVRADSNFKAVLLGLKTDTAELKKTNKMLNATKETLSNKLSENSLNIAEKITQSGKSLLKNLDELNNQITGGHGLIYFAWTINSETRNYNASIVNTSKYRMEVLQMMITDYDQLLMCKHKDTQGIYKIDRNCWNRNSKFIPDSNSQMSSVFISLTGQSIVDYPMPKVVGVHRYEIIITLRNQVYLELFVYRLNNDYTINQCIRLIAQNGKTYKVLKLFPSKDNEFNNYIKWDEFFPLPFNRMAYSLN